MYAIVQGGIVTDLVSLPVGVADVASLSFLSAAQIAAAVAVPTELLVSKGWTYSGGEFSPPPITSPPPTQAQIALAAVELGLDLTSTATPALNGTYALAGFNQTIISSIYSSLKSGDGFPGGDTPFSYHDAAGAEHFFTEAQFIAFALAVRDYVSAIYHAMYADEAMPSNAYTIA